MDVPQFLVIHLPIEGHIGCFQLLAIMNKAPIKIRAQVFMWTVIFSSFRQIPTNAITGS